MDTAWVVMLTGSFYWSEVMRRGAREASMADDGGDSWRPFQPGERRRCTTIQSGRMRPRRTVDGVLARRR
jgi:hypothetical protein